MRWYLPNTMDALDRFFADLTELYFCMLELVRLKLMLRVARRPADEKLGSEDHPSVLRWYLLPRNPFLNVWLHHVVAPDYRQEFHGHRWGYLTLILRGGYVEHRPGRPPIRLRTGMLAFRSRRTRHWIELPRQLNAERSWSLVFTGPFVG